MRWVLRNNEMRDRAIAALQRMNITLPMCLDLSEYKSKRSIEQNRRLWALYTAISQQAPAYMDGQWYSPEVWHHELAGRFLGYEPTPSGGGKPKSTAKLSVSAMCEYQMQIEAWAIQEFNLDMTWEQAA